MEVLPEAHGRSSKQREPPNNLQKRKRSRMNRGEAFGFGPTALRPPQMPAPFSPRLPLFYSFKKGAVSLINYLPTESNYLGFSTLYIKGAHT